VFEAVSGGSDTPNPCIRGLVPAGSLTGRVFAWNPNLDYDTLVVVAPGATRVEAVRTTGTAVPVPFDDGGGVLANARYVREIRAYDADGHLVARDRPNHGLAPSPVGP
jgi:hypothetical protein